MHISPYIHIARPDHWFKNIFMLPGALLVFFFDPTLITNLGLGRLTLGFLSACLVASSNYVLNEILDAEKDKHHPDKRHRPIPGGQISIPVAYAEWIALAMVGFLIGFLVNWHFGLMAVLLWVAGTLYNVPPIRLKDLAYADVLSESLNNPIRLAMGWYATGYMQPPPMSIILAYWMFGAFLMAMKRYAEYKHIGCGKTAAKYRNSFAYYNEERLVESIFFYGSLFGVLSGFFLARYHVEVILATPIVAYAMAYYMHLGFKENSPVQHPERLFRQKKLVWLLLAAFIACFVLLMVDIPIVQKLMTTATVEHLHPADLGR